MSEIRMVDTSVRNFLQSMRSKIAFSWRRWAWPAAGAAGALLMLIGAVGAGLRLPLVGALSPFAASSLLDYTGRPPSGFAPLTERFIEGQDPSGRSVGGVGGGVAALGGRTGSSARLPEPERLVVEHAFTNDDFANAFSVHSVPFTARTNTAQSGREQNEAGACAPAGGTAWYRYVPSEDVGLVANTFGTSFATALGVFTGPSLGRLNSVGCDTDALGNSLVGISARAGETYYFQVTGPAGGGPLVFTLEPAGSTALISLSSAGRQGNGVSRTPSISADGRYVVFMSFAPNLFPPPGPPPCRDPRDNFAFSLTPDPNRGSTCAGVFVRDRMTGSTRLVSVSSTGVPANDTSWPGFISDDGRYVAFGSSADNLLPAGEDTNLTRDAFVHDLLTGETKRVSVDSSGKESRDDTPRAFSGGSVVNGISGNGRFVAFQSWANNLVPGDTNENRDVFVHDRVTRQTTRVSVASDGSQRPEGGGVPTISQDGRFVAFTSRGAFDPNDTGNQFADIFVHDRHARETKRISVSDSGGLANGDSELAHISGDGRHVVFMSYASNLVESDADANALDFFVRDLNVGKTTLVSVSSSGEQAVGEAGETSQLARTNLIPTISYDGRYVAFSSDATRLVPDDTNGFMDAFLHDLKTRTTVRISVSSTGAQGNNDSYHPRVSADGRHVAFVSYASNMAPGDTNGDDVRDVFVIQRP